MATKKTISMVINPLTFIEADTPAPQNEIGLAEIMRFLCALGIPSDVTALVSRYKEIKDIPGSYLHLAPVQEKVLSRIVYPLRHAIGSYMLGSFLGTIALCGMVAEMLAIFLYEIAPFASKLGTLNAKGAEKIFGRTFEKLGQERRIDILVALGTIEQKTAGKLRTVKTIRNRYLHLLSKDDASAEKDARQAFRCAMEAIVEGLRFKIVDGKVHFRPEVLDAVQARE